MALKETHTFVFAEEVWCSYSPKMLPHPVSDPPKVHYFWRIQHAPVGIFEESGQHSWRGMLPGAKYHALIQVEHIVFEVLVLVMHQTYLVTIASLSCETTLFFLKLCFFFLKLWDDSLLCHLNNVNSFNSIKTMSAWLLALFLPIVVKIRQYQICFEFMEHILI